MCAGMAVDSRSLVRFFKHTVARKFHCSGSRDNLAKANCLRSGNMEGVNSLRNEFLSSKIVKFLVELMEGKENGRQRRKLV